MAQKEKHLGDVLKLEMTQMGVTFHKVYKALGISYTTFVKRLGDGEFTPSQINILKGNRWLP